MTPTPNPGPQPNSATAKRPTLTAIAATVIVGAMPMVFDTTIITVSLKTLAAELNASLATIQWITTGYMLAIALCVPLAVWAQRRLGGKRLWMVAIAAFMVASVLCALSWNIGTLIAFRAAQGLAGGITLPLTMTLLMQATQGRNLGRTMAAASMPAALGPVLGPVLGGIIVTWLNWQWMFWVNIPFGVVGLILAWRILPADRPESGRASRLDWTGVGLISPGLAGLLYGLTGVARGHGWSSPEVWLPLSVGAVLVFSFIRHALRHPDPLIKVRLLRQQPLAASAAVLFLSGAALNGAMFLLPMYWQVLRGYDALGAGLLLISQGVGTFISRSLAGKLTDSLGARRVAVVGFALVSLATVPFALAGASTPLWWLSLVLLVRGLGLGSVMVPISTAGFIGLNPAQIPHASVITRIAMQVGGAFGTALLAVVLESSIKGGIVVAADGAGLDQAFGIAFWWATGLAVVAAGVSVVLPGKRWRGCSGRGVR